MPLFELFRMSKSKLDSSQEKPNSYSNDIPIPENNFSELIWENGQVMAQGQSSKGRKTPLVDDSLQSNSFKPSFGDTNTSIGKLSLECGGLCELPVSAPSCGIGVSQDEDIVPWLNGPIGGGPLQNVDGSEALPELMGVSANGCSLQQSYEIMDKSCNRLCRNSDARSLQNDVDLGKVNAMKFPPCTIETTKTRANIDQSDPSSPLQSQPSLPSLGSWAVDSLGTSMSGVTCPSVCEYSTRLTTPITVHSSVKVQRLDSGLSNNSDGLMTLPCFMRPAYFSKDNVEDRRRASSSAPPCDLQSDVRDKISSVSSLNLSDPKFVVSGGSGAKEIRDCNQNLVANEKVDERKTDAKKYGDALSSKLPWSVSVEIVSKSDKFFDHNSNKEKETKGILDNKKIVEPLAGTSSVCSDNSVGKGPSDDQKPSLKRKSHDNEESDGPSEEVEEELVTVKKQASTRGSTARRSRAAEVHNLSERRRRDRINEKMRALQELIPNCNKVDKASMLDEAIEYLKSLQLQVQLMAMGAGMYMPHMMLPTGMQPMHPAPFAQMPRMGVGMGAGMGVGMGMVDINSATPGCQIIQVPRMQGAHYPNPFMSGPPTFHGMPGSNLQMFSLPVKGLPLSITRPPFIPLSGGPLMRSAPGFKTHGVPSKLENPGSAPPSSSKEQMQSTSNLAAQSGVSSCLTNHVPVGLMQNNFPSSKINGRRAAELVNEKDTGRARSHKGWFSRNEERRSFSRFWKFCGWSSSYLSS